MKKVRFSGRFGLLQKYLSGEIVWLLDGVLPSAGRESCRMVGRYAEFGSGERWHARFAVGDQVAVMMSYRDAGLSEGLFGSEPGWLDGMKAEARYMPHRFVVESVACVRASGIGEDVMLGSGVKRNAGGMYLVGGRVGGVFRDLRDAFAARFDAQFREGAWSSDPWVMVYGIKPIM